MAYPLPAVADVKTTATTLIAVVGGLGGAFLAYRVVDQVLLLSPERDPVDPTLPWYRGDGHSKLKLRYDFGPMGIILKAPLKKRELVGFRIEFRF